MCMFFWKVMSAPSAATRARRVPCLVVYGRGVWVYLVLYMCASVLKLVYLCGAGSPRVRGIRVYGQVQVQLDTYEHVV
jgi:hypothetical protein